MKRNPLGRGALFLFLLAAGPLSLGCEAILDFDRTPLQPEVEASVHETGAVFPDAGKKDTGSGDDDDDDKPDAKADANPIKDAGPDGDADR